MKKTAQFGLNQWEMSDRIQMQDFNRDNAAIEAALLNRNCQFYTASYIGDGETTKTWTFPGKPILIVISSASMVSIAVRGAEYGNTLIPNGFYQFKSTWSEKSVLFTNTNNDPLISANLKTRTYGMFAILEAE
mgnify:CR=1 FL=1